MPPTCALVPWERQNGNATLCDVVPWVTAFGGTDIRSSIKGAVIVEGGRCVVERSAVSPLPLTRFSTTESDGRARPGSGLIHVGGRGQLTLTVSVVLLYPAAVEASAMVLPSGQSPLLQPATSSVPHPILAADGAADAVQVSLRHILVARTDAHGFVQWDEAPPWQLPPQRCCLMDLRCAVHASVVFLATHLHTWPFMLPRARTEESIAAACHSLHLDVCVRAGAKLEVEHARLHGVYCDGEQTSVGLLHSVLAGPVPLLTANQKAYVEVKSCRLVPQVPTTIVSTDAKDESLFTDPRTKAIYTENGVELRVLHTQLYAWDTPVAFASVCSVTLANLYLVHPDDAAQEQPANPSAPATRDHGSSPQPYCEVGGRARWAAVGDTEKGEDCGGAGPFSAPARSAEAAKGANARNPPKPVVILRRCGLLVEVLPPQVERMLACGVWSVVGEPVIGLTNRGQAIATTDGSLNLTVATNSYALRRQAKEIVKGLGIRHCSTEMQWKIPTPDEDV